MEKSKFKFNKTVLLRADANDAIGMGHMMRCISVARAMLRDDNDKITPVFVISDERSAGLLAERELEFVCLHTDYRDKIPEVEDGVDSPMGQLFRNYHPVSMLVDSYQVEASYFTGLRRIAEAVAALDGMARTGIFYLDDVDVPDYELDGIINYNIYAGDLPYRQEKRFLGSAYIPLGEKFWDVKKRINNSTPESDEIRNSDNSLHCMISSGGADMLNICYTIGERMASAYPDCVFHVVCGKYNAHRSELLRLAEQHTNLCVEYDARDMCALEQNCDIAISAAGSTMYELAVLGVPTITYFFADNQRLVAEAFAGQTGMCNAGDYRVDSQAVLERIQQRFEEYKDNTLIRMNAGRRIRHVTDGLGAFRIAGILTGMEQTNL